MNLAASKLLLVGHDALNFGAQLVALNLARCWHNAGCEVTTLLLNDGPLVDEYRKHSRTVQVLRLHAQRDAEALLVFVNAFVAGGGDGAFCNTTVAGQVLPTLKRARITTMSLVHELPTTIRAMNLQQSARQIALLADMIVFPAQLVRTGFEEICPLDPSKIAIRPQGLYRQRPAGLDREIARKTVRQSLGLADDAQMILSVGVVDVRKGADLLPLVAKQVCARADKASFVWIGANDPAVAMWLAHDMQTMPIGSAMRFVPAITEWKALADYYGAADVFFLPSREDPFPTVVLEAMSFGLPVVCFDNATGAAELVSTGAGSVVPYLDIVAASDALAVLLSEPQIWRKCSEAAIACTARHPSFDDYALDLLELLATARTRK